MKGKSARTDHRKAVIEQYNDILQLIAYLDGYIEKNSLKRLLSFEKSSRGVDYILNKLVEEGVLNNCLVPLNKIEQKIFNRRHMNVYTFSRLTNKIIRGIDATRKKPTKQAILKGELKVRLITLKHLQMMKKSNASSLKMLDFMKWYLGTSTLLGVEGFSKMLEYRLDKICHPNFLKEEQYSRALQKERLEIFQRMGYLNKRKPINWELCLENALKRTREIDNHIEQSNLKMLRRELQWNDEEKRLKIEMNINSCDFMKLSEMNAYITGTGFVKGILSFEVAIIQLSDRIPTPIEVVNKIANVHFLLETLFTPFQAQGESPEINVFYTVYTVQTIKDKKQETVKQMLRDPSLGLYTLTALERVQFKGFKDI